MHNFVLFLCELMSPPLHRVSRVNQVTVAVLIDNFISATLEMETARLAAEAEIVKRKEQVSIRTRDSCAFQGFTLPDRIVSFQSQISKSHDSGIDLANCGNVTGNITGIVTRASKHDPTAQLSTGAKHVGPSDGGAHADVHRRP